MLFESASSNQMSDEELDEAVASHLKKLDTLEIMEKLLEKAKLDAQDTTPPNEPICNDSVTSCNWRDAPTSWLTNPRIFTREMFNMSSLFGGPEYKSKNVYSISNSGLVQPKKFTIQANEQSEEIEKEEKSNFLIRTRDYLVDYQESQGIPRDEYCFGSLLKIMGQATGKSFLALFFILVNIAPLTQILLFVSRFILDKTVYILSLQDTQQKATKTTIFGLQLISIYLCLFFIFGSIWLPILQMVLGVISQILFFN